MATELELAQQKVEELEQELISCRTTLECNVVEIRELTDERNSAHSSSEMWYRKYADVRRALELATGLKELALRERDAALSQLADRAGTS